MKQVFTFLIFSLLALSGSLSASIEKFYKYISCNSAQTSSHIYGDCHVKDTASDSTNMRQKNMILSALKKRKEYKEQEKPVPPLALAIEDVGAIPGYQDLHPANQTLLHGLINDCSPYLDSGVKVHNINAHRPVMLFALSILHENNYSCAFHRARGRNTLQFIDVYDEISRYSQFLKSQATHNQNNWYRYRMQETAESLDQQKEALAELLDRSYHATMSTSLSAFSLEQFSSFAQTQDISKRKIQDTLGCVENHSPEEELECCNRQKKLLQDLALQLDIIPLRKVSYALLKPAVPMAQWPTLFFLKEYCQRHSGAFTGQLHAQFLKECLIYEGSKLTFEKEGSLVNENDFQWMYQPATY